MRYLETLPKTPKDPERFLYVVQEPVIHEGSLAIPRGAVLSAVRYYQNTPHLVVEAISLSGKKTWTPAQGVLTRHSESSATVTLSHVTIPQRQTSTPQVPSHQGRSVQNSVGYRSK